MKLHFALIALGLCAGVAFDEAWHTVQPRANAEVFQQRLRCRTLADAYAKKNSDDYSTLELERVDFSPTRQSCVASISRAMNDGRGTIRSYDYETVDIMTGETLFSDSCIENDAKAATFCGNGRDMKLREKRDKALETVVLPR
jgi:hypothetical protein